MYTEGGRDLGCWRGDGEGVGWGNELSKGSGRPLNKEKGLGQGNPSVDNGPAQADPTHEPRYQRG